MGALTLADMAQLSTVTPFTQAVLYSILSASPLAARLPFEETGDLQTLVMEATGLPTPSHRPINPSSVTIATAKFGQRTETLKIMSDKIPVDRQLLNNRSSHVNPKTAAMEQYTKAVAYELVDQYVNGSPATDPDEPGGLAYRFQTDTRISDGTATPSTQLQVIDANDQNRDMTSAAEQQDLLNDIHELMSLIDGGNPDILLTNRQGWLNIGIAARAQRMMAVTRDFFGRAVQTFGEGGPVVIDAGYPPASVITRGTQVIPTSTTANDITSDAIFAIKFGPTLSGGLQKGTPEAMDFAENSADFPNVVGAYEWVYGFHLTNPFSVALLRRAF